MAGKLSDAERSARYVEQGGGQCPHCQAFAVQAGPQNCRCAHCGAIWVEQHPLTGIADIKEGE